MIICFKIFGRKSLGTKTVRMTTASACTFATLLKPSILLHFYVIETENVCHKVELVYVRWRDYTELRIRILLCMTYEIVQN